MLAFCAASVGFSESDDDSVQERKLNGIYNAVSSLISSAYTHHKDLLHLVIARQIYVRDTERKSHVHASLYVFI